MGDAGRRQVGQAGVQREPGRGVVSAPYRSIPGAEMPRVPIDAACRPSRVQIWRVKVATEVLPLVPVTAAITSGWRP